MTLWRSDPERAADALIDASFADLDIPDGARLLLIEQAGSLPETLTHRGYPVTVWNRRLSGARAATAEPPSGPFDVALLRLPKSKHELEMSAHLACAHLAPNGRLLIYGGNDEGVRHAAKRLASLATDITTLSTRAHGRIIALSRPSDHLIKNNLAAWREELNTADAPIVPWTTYPGLFARGSLDDGTALLLAHLPKLPANPRVLDYGCGTGVIAHALHLASPHADIDAIDHDTVALVATRENVPCANVILATDLTPVLDQRYDLIISNPPIHNGIREDHAALHRLIAQAKTCLKPKAPLLLVVQRRIALQSVLAEHYKTIVITAETSTFRIWTATHPH